MRECIEYERYNRESKRPSTRDLFDGCIYCGRHGGSRWHDCTSKLRVTGGTEEGRKSARKFRRMCIECWDERQIMIQRNGEEYVNKDWPLKTEY